MERRASEVIELLRSLLGLENEGGGGGGGGSMGSSSQLTSMMRQMQQQMQKISSAGKGGGGGKEPTKTRLVLNQRENMILVQAAPDQMAIIDKAIQQIDVPIEAGNSLLQNLNRMKVYRMETVDPQSLVDLLQELGDMDPGTVLKVDTDKKSILAWASLADHLTITTLVERLDQSGRTFEVIPLRRLDAEYVTGTIRALMAPPPKKNNASSYNYYSRYSYGEPEKKEDNSEFKVEADLENNRLLVYANKVEMEEIMGLLQKLGEIPDPAAMDNGIRVFEMSPNEDPHRVMERLKQLWRRDNELQIDLPKKEDADSKTEETPDDEKTGDAITSNVISSTSAPQFPGSRQTHFDKTHTSQITASLTAEEFFRELNAATASPAISQLSGRTAATKKPARDPVFSKDRVSSSAAGTLPASETAPQVLTAVQNDPRSNDRRAAPVRFSISPDGRLIVTSDDPAALNEVEDLLSSNDKALEKKEGQKQQQQSRYSYFGSSTDSDDDSPIRFKGLLSIGVDPISDTLVVSSTASLMETISELILELDKAAETSSSVQILKLDPSVNIALIQERLSEALGTAGRKPAGQPKNRNGREAPNGIPVGAQPNPGSR
ncbi:MAG: hypothetical protein ABGZ53_03500 [Fuerstiella sp.]